MPTNTQALLSRSYGALTNYLAGPGIWWLTAIRCTPTPGADRRATAAPITKEAP